jgi:acetylornithine/N-succinyldiaminopimelate aminotransferase
MSEQTIEQEKEYVLGVYARPPFVIERGEGCTLYDSEGNAYLDCVSGIAVNALGYNDPGINKAIAESAATGVLHVSNLYHTEPHAELAELLCTTSFADKVHYCNSGAEANEGAIKFARRYGRAHGGDDKVDILAFTGAFHGRTMGALAVTPRPAYQDAFQPLMPGVRFAEFNNLKSARAQMDENVCAILVEPIQGEGGIHPATPAFLQGLRALADEYDALLIYDEVQCGVGRSGKLWGYMSIGVEADDRVEPDIMTAAKPLAGGLPMGAILVRQKVADVMQKGDHGSTFAGGPMVAHVATHVVGRIAEPAFLAEVTGKGERLVEMLEEVNSPHIVEIRGKGLLVGVELDVPAGSIVSQAYEHGVMLVNAGPNVLRFIPPLVISEDELARAVHVVASILQEM